MKYLLVLLILTHTIFAEDEVVQEEEGSEEIEAAQFMPMPMEMGNPMGSSPFWGMNPMMGMGQMMHPMMSPMMNPMMNPMGMGMMYSDDSEQAQLPQTGADSAQFMMMPMGGGCGNTCMCRQRCAMVFWMPCNCGPCNGCGCCKDDDNGDGSIVPTPPPTQPPTEPPTEPPTQPPTCDRSCCNRCSCQPCMIWWKCPPRCPSTCCSGGGCCNTTNVTKSPMYLALVPRVKKPPVDSACIDAKNRI